MRATIAVLSALMLLALPGATRAQEEGPPEVQPTPLLTVEAIEVQPEAPAADTLCQLRIRVHNRGERIASQLGFRVAVAGQELPVYRNQLFMQALPPGEVSEVRLYNFWSTETGRPAPADGRLRVEVELTEAHWYSIADNEDGVEVWTPLESVSGLPSRQSVTLAMPGAAPLPASDG